MNFLKFINWQKPYAKENIIDEKNECLCKSTDGFFITRRQASAISSVFILAITFFLVFGYFWGQRKAIQEFTSKVISDSFADQVNYSMYSIYGDNSATESEEQEEEQKPEQSSGVQQPKSADRSPVNVPTNPVGQAPSESQMQDKTQYFAQLVGFGSQRAAEQFVNKVRKKGYNVYVVPRSSRTAKGRVINWYQVITDKFNDKSDLINQVNQIKASERLGEIKFITTK